jgi:hypothetical protein
MLPTAEAYVGGTTETTMVKAPYTPIVYDAEATRVHSGSGVAVQTAFDVITMADLSAIAAGCVARPIPPVP